MTIFILFKCIFSRVVVKGEGMYLKCMFYRYAHFQRCVFYIHIFNPPTLIKVCIDVGLGCVDENAHLHPPPSCEGVHFHHHTQPHQGEMHNFIHHDCGGEMKTPQPIGGEVEMNTFTSMILATQICIPSPLYIHSCSSPLPLLS